MDEPIDSIDLAVNAAVSWLDTYGGLWSGDRDEVRQAFAVMFGAAEDLGSDYPETWQPAVDTLEYIAVTGRLPAGK
jgi:hypothetical protein